MKNHIIKLSQKHQLSNIVDRVNKLDSSITLKIGFLGEFSSGKSTLINALLNQKILPSMDRPTTKSIVEVVAKDNLDKTLFFRIDGEDKKPISAVEFADIALEESDFKAQIHVKSNSFFKEGYEMIDTPGISSLEDSDIDITYGYLPFLDCAVICNHIQKGGLTQSIIDFLLKDEIKPIINNFIFVLTNSHTKTSRAKKRIKRAVISQLESLNESNSLGIENIESKVVVVSALEAMYGKKGFTLDEIKGRFREFFIKRGAILEKNRLQKELDKLYQELLDTLIYKKSNSKLDISDLKAKESKIEESINELERKRASFLESLKIVEPKIQDSIKRVLLKYVEPIKQIKEVEAISSIIDEITKEVVKEVNYVIQKHFESFNIDDDISHIHSLRGTIEDILKSIDIGKDIGVVLLIEILTLGTAGAGGAFGLFLRGASKMIVEDRRGGSLKYTAELIERVNPMEFIGDKIGELIVEQKIRPQMEKLSITMASDINYELNRAVENQIFEPLESELKSKRVALETIYGIKEDRTKDFNDMLESLDRDILELKSLKKDSNA